MFHVNDLRDAVAFHRLLLTAYGANADVKEQYLRYECLFLDWLKLAHVSPSMLALSPANVRNFLRWYRDEPDSGAVRVRAASDVLARLGVMLEDNGLVDDNPLALPVDPFVQHAR